MSVIIHPPPPRTTHKHLLAQHSYRQSLKTQVRDLHCTYTTKKKKRKHKAFRKYLSLTSYPTSSAATASLHRGLVIHMAPLDPSQPTESSCSFQWLLDDLFAQLPGRSTLPMFTNFSLCVPEITLPLWFALQYFCICGNSPRSAS